MYPQSPDEDIRFVELVIGSFELPLGSGNQTDPPEKQPVFSTSKSSLYALPSDFTEAGTLLVQARLELALLLFRFPK